jgi:hypothetical protein
MEPIIELHTPSLAHELDKGVNGASVACYGTDSITAVRNFISKAPVGHFYQLKVTTCLPAVASALSEDHQSRESQLKGKEQYG